MADQTTTETPVVTVPAQPIAEPDPAQRPARLALYLGVVLVALGGVALYLGYNGVATNNVQVAQTPYLISGGMVGLGLLALGGVTLAVYVLLRVQADMRMELSGMREAIEHLGDSLAGSLAYKASNGTAATANGHVMVARGASSFHRPDCRLVSRAEHVRPVSRSEAENSGLTGCRVCNP